MSDHLNPVEGDTIEIITKLSEPDIDLADPALGHKLQKEDKPQLRELGSIITEPGSSSMLEYDARLQRAREAVGLESTTVEPEMREKFEWRSGEVVNLNELLDQAKTD